jgi:hypothetical protein
VKKFRTLIAPDDTAVRIPIKSFLMPSYDDELYSPICKEDCLSVQLQEACFIQWENSQKYAEDHPDKKRDIFISGHC